MIVEENMMCDKCHESGKVSDLEARIKELEEKVRELKMENRQLASIENDVHDDDFPFADWPKAGDG